LFAFAGAFAQNISVADFYYAENDLTARTHGTSEEDQNGNICALIKVKTTEKGTWTFDVGMLGVTKTEMQNAAHAAEIWVYVPFGVTWMSIQHEKLGELDHFRFPCSIDKGCTYVMKLTTGKVITIVEEEVRQQYLLFQLDPPNAILEVNDKLWNVEADGTAMKYVDFGTYKYRVRAFDYSEIVGKVTVDDPNNTKIVPVKLKSNLAEVTLKVDADAEIWVNNQKKGVRTWTGNLGSGTYKIECKQDGHETTMVSKEISTEMNGETLTLPAPTPIYGSLMVESTPNLCQLYIDDKDYGTTPKSINNILVGQHEIRLTKDGYDEHKETVTIAKGERKQVKATLSIGKEIQFTCNVPNAQLEIDGRLVGDAQGGYQLSFGQHNLRATAPGYQEFTASITITENIGNSFNITLNSAQETGQVIHQEVPAAKPRNITWEDVAITEDPQDVQGMVFLTEVVGTSGWGNAMGPTVGYKNAVKEIQKKAAAKGCCVILVTKKEFSGVTKVTARLYLCK
jgi:hypothetical protein